MRYQIEHHTLLSFDQAVVEQCGELRLLPRTEGYQKIHSFKIQLEPTAKFFHYVDAYGNQVHYFSIIPSHQKLEIRFHAELENNLENPFNFIPLAPEEERRQIDLLLKEHPRWNDYVLSISDTVPSLKAFEGALDWPRLNPKNNLIEAVQRAMEWLKVHFTYLPGVSYVHCPFREILEKRAGVCQDFSHLLIAIVRSWGVPARYVMGYQFSPKEATAQIQPATHAWVEVYLPGRGWQGFDPSHQLLANNTYIPVAVGRDSHDAAPQRGCFKGSAVAQEPQVELSVIQQQ